ncbi:MAG: response regulator [Cellvibrio sp.]|uniref:hybrid sensor histidine kinase/response regulator n=1 Tax=Cellvibrio sp. TaxID=1965322 RepID=UPI0031A1ADDE
MTTTMVNILVVDDERANLLTLGAVLKGLDVNLVFAASGEEALRQALRYDFAVILLDFYLPTIGGLEVAQIIRTRSSTPIIFITASGPDDFPIEEAYSLGAVDYLNKPYNSTVLKSKVAFYIELHKRTEALAASERSRYLSELSVKDGRIRLILENAKGYAFIVTDIDGTITEWEGDASVVTGWSANEAIGQSIGLIYTAEDRFAGYPQIELSLAKLDGLASNKRWYVSKDERRFCADGVLVPLKDSANQVHGFSKIFRDVTVEQLAVDELRRLADSLAEADKRKTEFLATLAHELRNPLAPIRNGLEILRMGGDSTIPMEKTREMMERQVTHMVHLVDDLLDISRINGGKIVLKKETIAIKELIASAVEASISLIESGQHTLTINIFDDSLMLHVDAIRIAQVITNLLNNAAKYTPLGGRIDVSVKVDGQQVILSVEDNGIGIPAAAQQSIFEMFKQVDRNIGHAQGGLGIGLTLVRQIVEMHGGTVDVTSSEGLGSKFSVKLSIEEASLIGAKTPAVAVRRTEPQPLRIMVVDDNVDAAESLSALLQFGGHTLYVAYGGVEAIKIAESCKPHIVFLDIGMPDMDGYQTASAMRKVEGLRDTKLVALTGWGAEEDKCKSHEAGFDNHLTKPAQLEAIEALITTLGAVPVGQV